MNLFSVIDKKQRKFIKLAFTVKLSNLYHNILWAFASNVVTAASEGKYSLKSVTTNGIELLPGDFEDEMMLKVSVNEISDYIKFYFDMSGNFKDYEIGAQ